MATGSDEDGDAVNDDSFSWLGTDSSGSFNSSTTGNFTVKAFWNEITSNSVSVTVTAPNFPPAAPNGLIVQ